MGEMRENLSNGRREKVHFGLTSFCYRVQHQREDKLKLVMCQGKLQTKEGKKGGYNSPPPMESRTKKITCKASLGPVAKNNMFD